MREWLRSSDGWTAAAALAILAGAGATASVPDGVLFLAFAALIAVSDLFEVTLPNDVRYSLGLAPALGFALLGRPVSETLVVFAAGAALAIAARAAVRRDPRLYDAARQTVTVAGASAAYQWLASYPQFDTFPNTDMSAVGLFGMLGVAILVESLQHAGRRAHREEIPFRPVFAGVLRSTWALHLSVISVAALLALAKESPIDYWSFPLFLAPLAATQFAFHQFATIRKTYLQTISALSKVPEMAGYTAPGHSTRVANISVAIAQELGVPEREQGEIQYAALLHDIGKVSLPDPEEANAVGSHLVLAVVGAGIVRETGHFPKVAEMIEHQYDPHRRRGETSNDTLPIGARIIKVASAYDDTTKPGGVGLSPWDAIERLLAGTTYEYDPNVIQALIRVLEKRSAI